MELNNMLTWMKERNVFLDTEKILNNTQFQYNDITASYFLMPWMSLQSKAEILTKDVIIKDVLSFYEITEAELYGEGRKRNVVEPRQMAQLLIRMIMKFSYPKIADIFNKKIHSSIIYSVRTVSGEYQTDKKIRSNLDHFLMLYDIPVSDLHRFIDNDFEV